MSLSYTATDVLLNLNAALGAGAGLSGNQQNVANAVNGFFNNGGALPASFVSVFGLTGGNLANALTQLSGSDGCQAGPTNTEGCVTGLVGNNAQSMALSADSKSAYALSGGAVVDLTRDTTFTKRSASASSKTTWSGRNA